MGPKFRHPASKRHKDSLDIKAAQEYLYSLAKSPPIDRSRLAQNVAPARAMTSADVAAQKRWAKRPTKMDFEGVDAPFGSATIGTPTASKTGEPFAPLLIAHVPMPQLVPASAPDGTKTTAKATFIPKLPDGKPILKKWNIKKLEDAVALGPEALSAAVEELSKKLNSPSKKAALGDIAASLYAAHLGANLAQEGEDGSQFTQTVGAVAKGKIKTPKSPAPGDATFLAQEKAILSETKPWDSDLGHVSGKKGTNEGGLYKDKQLGSYHYVKWGNESRMRMEWLAGALYRQAGVPVPDTRVITFGGKPAIMSDWISGVKPMSIAQMAAHPDVRRFFAVDAWLANWDVVGLSSDNIVEGPDGTAYRVDPGGALIYRAQGKPKDFGNTVLELESMRSPNKAPQASKVFVDLTRAELKAGADAITKVTDMQIKDLVQRSGIPAQATADYHMGRDQIADALIARRNWLIKAVLKAEVEKKIKLKDLGKVVSLKPESLSAIATEGPKLNLNAMPTARRTLATKVFNNELGKSEAAKVLKEVETHYTSWKSVTGTDQGNIFRWAAAEAVGRGELAEKRLRQFWEDQAPSKAKSISSTFSQNQKGVGPLLVNGSKVSGALNTGVFVTQIPKLKGKASSKAQTVTVYRTWRPDQIKHMGLVGAHTGDIIEIDDPIMFSYTLSPAVFAGHGSLRVKAAVPVGDVMFSDRVNNFTGSLVGEDEVLFVGKKSLQLEVAKG